VPLPSGYSIPEPETGLKLPLTDVGDVHLLSFLNVRFSRREVITLRDNRG